MGKIYYCTTHGPWEIYTLYFVVQPMIHGQRPTMYIVQSITHGQLILHPPWAVQWPYSPWDMHCTVRCTANVWPMSHGQNVTLHGPWPMGNNRWRGSLPVFLLTRSFKSSFQYPWGHPSSFPSGIPACSRCSIPVFTVWCNLLRRMSSPDSCPSVSLWGRMKGVKFTRIRRLLSSMSCCLSWMSCCIS